MNDLDELKSLLFGAEKQTLDSIAERVERRETRAADVADILPEAISSSHRKGGELVDALKEPVGRCLQESFHEQPQFYGDALYPVMGPAIRKSIMHTLRTFAEEINTAMEQSLSAKGIRWRFQAWRAGVPFGEFVLQQTLLFRVEQAYLISRENGLLIAHVHHEVAKIKDSDAVSAMFTAIQDFVKESFSPDRTGRLETADMGEFTLWAVHGPHALLVCVIRGLPPKSLRADLSAILERIHFRYGDAIRNYAGDTGTVEGVEEELTSCLRFEAQQAKASGRKRISLPSVILLAAMLALVVGYAFMRWNQVKDYQRFADSLAATPGIYVGELQRDGADMHLRGMRDPLAASVAEVAAAAGIETARVTADLRPFQSLDAAIVLRRATQVLQPPDGVDLSLSGTELVASGPVPLGWRTGLRAELAAMPGIGSLRIDSQEWRALEAGIAAASGQRFYFSAETALVEDSIDALADHARKVGELAALAATLGGSLAVTLVGYTDGTGSSEFNARLAAQRTDLVERAMLGAGVPEAAIVRTYEIAASESVDFENRRVEVRIEPGQPATE